MTVEVECCANGHPWNSVNTRWESSGAGGRMRKRCRQCRRDKKAAQKAGSVEGSLPRLAAENSRRVQPEPPTALELANVTDFNTARKFVDPLCNNKPGMFSDYDEDVIPSPRNAMKMCAPCPLLALCRDYARTTKPDWGVWGGQVWVFGEVFNGGKA
jgi:hypothetical protein